MKEKEKKGELGYEGISWTKYRVRRYKLDEVQEKKMEEQAGQSPDKKRERRKEKKKKGGGISWTKSRGGNGLKETTLITQRFSGVALT